MKESKPLIFLIWQPTKEKMFGMYGGKEEWVRMECDNSFAGVMIDRFGKDVSMIRLDDKKNVYKHINLDFITILESLSEYLKMTHSFIGTEITE